MEFNSEDERDEYFLRIEADSTAVEYGAALRHAETTNLGFWGSEDDLFDDCSKIMLAEVNKFAGQTWCRICDIQLAARWHYFYEAARAKPRNEMAAAYREIYQQTQNEALAEEANKLRSPLGLFSDLPPYQIIYEEIKSKGLIEV